MHPHPTSSDKEDDYKPKVLLWFITDACLIIEWSSGVRYENQTSGLDCLPREQQGILAPLGLSEEALQTLFDLPFPSLGVGISSDLAEQLDSFFRSQPGMSFFEVDRERLEESSEAWVYVKLGSVPAVRPLHVTGYVGPVFGFSGHRAVLTWSNSD